MCSPLNSPSRIILPPFPCGPCASPGVNAVFHYMTLIGKGRWSPTATSPDSRSAGQNEPALAWSRFQTARLMLPQAGYPLCGLRLRHAILAPELWQSGVQADHTGKAQRSRALSLEQAQAIGAKVTINKTL